MQSTGSNSTWVVPSRRDVPDLGHRHGAARLDPGVERQGGRQNLSGVGDAGADPGPVLQGGQPRGVADEGTGDRAAFPDPRMVAIERAAWPGFASTAIRLWTWREVRDRARGGLGSHPSGGYN